MAVKITWSLNVQVANGPKITGTDTLDVDAYDNIEVTVPKKVGATSGTVTVQVQPSGADKVKLLIIKSSVYKDLTYAIDGGLTGIKLDAQQLFIGAGAVGLLGAAGPKTIIFTNESTTVAPIVQVLVGRKIG